MCWISFNLQRVDNKHILILQISSELVTKCFHLIQEHSMLPISSLSWSLLFNAFRFQSYLSSVAK